MYFRTKSIKGSQLVQLVHSYRNAEGLPRQRVIASLGDAKLPETEKNLIARAVDRRLHGLEDFFEASLSSEAAAWVDRIVRLADRSQAARPVPQTTVDGVVVDSINTTDVVELGPELVALKAWEELQFTPMLESLGMNPSAIATAQLMISNRLIEPLSEWALIDWSHRTALPEILDIRITKSSKDRLYRTSDELMTHRQDIESALRNQNVQREISISPFKVESFYRANLDKFKLEDQVKLRMIVLTKADASDTNTLKLAREIQSKIKDGAKFTEMATVYSQGSQQHQAGDWGWVERTVLRKELAEVAFALPVGQVSDVIDMPDSCYLVLVEEKKPAQVKPLSEVRPEVEKTLRVQQQAKLQKQWIDGLKKKTFIRYF